MLQIGRSLVRSHLVSLEFFIDIKSFRSHYGPGIDSASNRNEYQEYFVWGKGSRCLRLTTLPPSCAVVTKSGSLNFLEPSGPLRACNGTALPLYNIKGKFLNYTGICNHHICLPGFAFVLFPIFVPLLSLFFSPQLICEVIWCSVSVS